MLYHFITGHILRNDDPIELFMDVMNSGELVSSKLRDNKPPGLWMKEDPEEDKEYIFLTSNRYFMHEAIDTVNNVYDRREKEKRISLDIYGFVINPFNLRYNKNVLLREHDSSSNTRPFTDQVLRNESEILVSDRIGLKESVEYYIYRDREICHDILIRELEELSGEIDE